MQTSGGWNIGVGVVIKENLRTACLQSIEKLRKEAEAKGTIQLQVKLNADGTRKQIEKLTTSNGEYAKIVSTLDKNNKVLSQSIVEVGKSAKNTTKETNKLKNSQDDISKNFGKTQNSAKGVENQLNKNTSATRNLNTETKKGVDVFSDFALTFEKMVKFNTINMIYDGIIDSIRECITITEEFNEATTELIKVSELSGDSLRQYTKELAEYGEDVGRTMTDMTNSATIFKRTGATDEEAKELARLAEMYRNVADSEISSAEASSFLVSQMKAFGIQAENSIHILDGVNEVANHFATSTDDLQTALTKSASALATAGNSYEQTIALVTSGVEVMQGQAGTVGNGLRTIAINVANLATKQNELVVANGKFSISLKDTNGEIRSTYDILSDLAQNWDKLNKAEQNAIAVQLAGKHKYKSLVLLA